MAAQAKAWEPQVVDLRRVAVQELEPLLEEESAAWRVRFQWDFTGSAALVRQFVGSHALNGCALKVGDEVAGYSYFVCEDHKGLIGDLYVSERFATAEHERQLLDAVLIALRSTPLVLRIEAQLLMMRYAPKNLGWGEKLERYPRLFLQLDLREAPRWRPQETAERYQIERWRHEWLDEAAGLIARSYAGHADARINDQYRTEEGARRFLGNITRYPGCGEFSTASSWAAFDRTTGKMVGMVMGSEVAANVGHITQICTAPEARGRGLGYELLRRTLESFRRQEMSQVSLTVTEDNRAAMKLYESTGFAVRRRFDALVWEAQ